jgi:hypothetical protein
MRLIRDSKEQLIGQVLTEVGRIKDFWFEFVEQGHSDANEDRSAMNKN